MRKAILGLMPAVILATVCWAGSDPWKDKPYSQWDDKDIQHIMTSSPWMRTVSVTAGWAQPDYNLPGDNPRPAQQQPSGGGGMGGQGKGGGGSSSPSSGNTDSPSSTPEVEFQVYWMSSRTIRGALGRRAILHGGKDAAEVDRAVAAPTDEFEILVQGRDMAPFINNDEKFFQANSHLEIKKSKEKLSPSHVTMVHGANGKTVTSASFFFPKKSAAGEDQIAPDEKDVQFTVSLGKSTLKVDFEPRKMDDQKGPDL
jgi:hypothetical protein